MTPIINYFKESWQELKKVNWPSRQQTVKLTLAVMIFSFVLALFMGVIDIGLNEALRKVLID